MIEVLTRWLAVSDRDNKDWLLQLSRTSWLNDHWLQDFRVQLAAHGCHSGELDLRDELLDLLCVSDAVALGRRVHEADLDTVGVEQRCGECDPVKDELEIVNSLAILLERHGTTVIDVEDDVEESQFDDILTNLRTYAPLCAELFNLSSCSLCNLIDLRTSRWIEALQILLLNCRL